MRSSTNYLLSKDDIGRAKTATRTLPPGGHTFGYKDKPDAVGVRGCKLLKSLPLIHFPQYSNFSMAHTPNQGETNAK